MSSHPLPDLKKVLDVKDVIKILPHRYPFLLVDRILEIDLEKSLHVVPKAIKFGLMYSSV